MSPDLEKEKGKGNLKSEQQWRTKTKCKQDKPLFKKEMIGEILKHSNKNSDDSMVVRRGKGGGGRKGCKGSNVW